MGASVMKKVLLLLLFLFGISFGFVHAAEEWKKGPDSRWHINLESALEQAKRERKFVYVLNTGSDWCGFCKVLMKNVLQTDYFADLIQKHIVPVYLDSPSQKIPMPQEQRDYNKATARKLKFGGGVPSAIILDSNGEKVGSIGGYRPQAIYITELYKILNIPGCPDFPATAKLILTKGKKKKEANVTITHWGTSHNKIDKPFNAAKEINVPPCKKIFFKVICSLPPRFKGKLIIKDTEGESFQSSAKINRSGTYILSAVSPARNDYWGYRNASFYALIKTSTKGYRGAYAQIPCRVKVDPKLLNENEKLAYEAQNAKLRDDFSKAKFEIIRWGLNAKTENQYCPGQEIKVPKRKTVCLLLRYTMPGPAAIMTNNYKYIRNQSYNIRPATGTVLCYASGYSKTSELYISIRPKKGELLKEIITIPCRIIPE